MRLLRAGLLLALLAAGMTLGARSVRGPLVEGWRAVRDSDRSPAGAPAADLTTLLTGGCALLLVLAGAWLVAAVGACTWEALRTGPTGGVDQASTFLRPRILRAAVLACLGVTALTGQTAQAQSPASQVQAVPDDLRPSAVTIAVATLRALDGLPVPDRATGRFAASPPQADEASHGIRRVQVAPGDSLWSLTARLLPAGTDLGTVATGWRLLYAANRGIVGADPDVLQPGQILRVDPALEALVRAARGNHDVPPLDHHAGGAR